MHAPSIGTAPGSMSLTVPTALLDPAKARPVDDTEFIECVRDSPPYAWKVISEVAGGCTATAASSPTTTVSRRRTPSRTTSPRAGQQLHGRHPGASLRGGSRSFRTAAGVAASPGGRQRDSPPELRLSARVAAQPVTAD